MLHTYVDEDAERAGATVAGPLRAYLRSALALEYSAAAGGSLLGSISGCAATVRTMARAGVDEIACLVDFGVDEADVLGGLERLAAARADLERAAAAEAVTPPQAPAAPHPRG